MKPVSPVARNLDDARGCSETIFAKDQREYIPLPALRFNDGLVVTRWELSWKERFRIFFGGSVFLGLLTFNRPLQPVKLSTSIHEVTGIYNTPEETNGTPIL